jgi:NAD(P)H-hydrate epimerase
VSPHRRRADSAGARRRRSQAPIDGDLGPLLARTAPTIADAHEGEYRRLTGRGGVRSPGRGALAEASGAVVLLKGPGTVVAALVAPPRSLRRAAVLATAGSGDVLTGIVAGFLARGLPVFEAAAAAAWVHGAVADRLVAEGGPGLVATDLVAGLPSTLARL